MTLKITNRAANRVVSNSLQSVIEIRQVVMIKTPIWILWMHFVLIDVGPVVSNGLPNVRTCFSIRIDDNRSGKYAEAFIDAGSNGITFHIETVKDPVQFIKYLKSKGVSVR
jgi:hypothetical protein